MTKSSLVPVLLFCLCLVSVASPSLAQAGRNSGDNGDDPVAKLQRAGWMIVQDGVLQRQARPGEIETFVFGAEGFTWKLRELRRQLTTLRGKFQADPTPELRRAIASHRKAIASTLEMIERARAAEASGAPFLPKSNCTFSFGSQAYASPKADRQGTQAEASAFFNGPRGCPLTGEAYAYAFAEATVNGALTTMTVTDGPRTGAAVSASAAADRDGGPLCESYAFATLTINYPTPISYNRTMENESCPLPSPDVSIDSNQPTLIELAEGECVRITWTVNIPHGVGYMPRIYRNNVLVTSGTFYAEQVCNDPQSTGWIDLVMRFEFLDGAGQSKSLYRRTRVDLL